MTELDALIYKLAFLAVLVALLMRGYVIPAFLVCTSFVINELIFILDPTWKELENLYFSYAVKDFAIAIILLSMYRPSTFILGMLFIVSALFHKFAQIEVANKILDLKHIRTDFVTYITAFQIATIYASLIVGGGWNGGNRARRTVSNSSGSSRSLFHYQACKVKP